MSRYTGMRHVLLKEDIATRVQKLMRAGLMKEPVWLKVSRAAGSLTHTHTHAPTHLLTYSLTHLFEDTSSDGEEGKRDAQVAHMEHDVVQHARHHAARHHAHGQLLELGLGLGLEDRGTGVKNGAHEESVAGTWRGVRVRVRARARI